MTAPMPLEAGLCALVGVTLVDVPNLASRAVYVRSQRVGLIRAELEGTDRAEAIDYLLIEACRTDEDNGPA